MKRHTYATSASHARSQRSSWGRLRGRDRTGAGAGAAARAPLSGGNHKSLGAKPAQEQQAAGSSSCGIKTVSAADCLPGREVGIGWHNTFTHDLFGQAWMQCSTQSGTGKRKPSKLAQKLCTICKQLQFFLLFSFSFSFSFSFANSHSATSPVTSTRGEAKRLLAFWPIVSLLQTRTSTTLESDWKRCLSVLRAFASERAVKV